MLFFSFRRNFNKSLCKNIFLESSYLRPLPLICVPPQLKISPSPTTCAVDYFQCLIFINSHSPYKFTGKPKIVSHPTSSQESLKHKSMFKFTLQRQDMWDAGGRRRTRVSGNPVGEYLHIDTAGNRGAVGGATSLMWDVCKGDRVRRREAQEGVVVAPIGDKKTTLGHPGRLSGS